MEQQLLELISEGISISTDKTTGNWTVSYHNALEHCDTLKEAIQIGYTMLNKKTYQDYTTVVRYSRGLGIEYKNLSIIQASNQEEATQKALQIIEETFEPTVDIREVKVRRKGP
jgi:hypothetical protein